MAPPAVARPHERPDWSKPVYMTVDEHLEFEEGSLEKHEYSDGWVRPLGRLIAMAGGTIEHTRVISNINGEVRSKLKGTRCFALDSNIRVKPRGRRKYSYTDVTIVCGEAQIDPDTSRRRAG